MDLEIKTWLQDIYRSIEEIDSFLPSKRIFLDFQNDLKQIMAYFLLNIKKLLNLEIKR